MKQLALLAVIGLLLPSAGRTMIAARPNVQFEWKLDYTQPVKNGETLTACSAPVPSHEVCIDSFMIWQVLKDGSWKFLVYVPADPQASGVYSQTVQILVTTLGPSRFVMTTLNVFPGGLTQDQPSAMSDPFVVTPFSPQGIQIVHFKSPAARGKNA